MKHLQTFESYSYGGSYGMTNEEFKAITNFLNKAGKFVKERILGINAKNKAKANELYNEAMANPKVVKAMDDFKNSLTADQKEQLLSGESTLTKFMGDGQKVQSVIDEVSEQTGEKVTMSQNEELSLAKIGSVLTNILKKINFVGLAIINALVTFLTVCFSVVTATNLVIPVIIMLAITFILGVIGALKGDKV